MTCSTPDPATTASTAASATTCCPAAAATIGSRRVAGGKDTIDCGPGDDTVLKDKSDIATNCEHFR